MDWSGIGVIGGLCVAGITVISFWMRFSDRITEARAAADDASKSAESAKSDAHQAIEKIGVLSAAFSLYREQVAREYIHREVMREVEDRLTQAIERLGDRLDRFVEAAGRNNRPQ